MTRHNNFKIVNISLALAKPWPLFFAGALSAFSAPPLYWLPFFWLAFLPLVGASYSLKGKPLVFAIFIFFMGRMICSYYWVLSAPVFIVGNVGWLLGFVVVISVSLMSVFSCLLMSFVIAYFLKRPFSRVLGLIFVWSLSSYFLLNIFSGFPWALAGYDLVFSDHLLASSAYFGIFGLTFINFLAVCLCLGALFIRSWYPVFVSAAVVSGAFFVGYYHLNFSQYLSEDLIDAPTVKVVQPNVRQENKWTQPLQEQVQTLIGLSGSGEKANIIVWPETSVPTSADISHIYGDIARLSGLREGDYIISGKPEVTNNRLYNAMFVIDDKGNQIANYYKNHLVPFGEYIPLSRFFPKSVQHLVPNFSSGVISENIDLKIADKSTLFAPLICYEVLFSGELWQGERPRMIINITNDAWYLETAGPWQHYIITKVRAVEEGIPIIRSANTGISGIINSYGKSVKSIPLFEQGTITAKAPPRLEQTFYSKHGNLLLFIALAILAIVTVIYDRRRGQKQ